MVDKYTTSPVLYVQSFSFPQNRPMRRRCTNNNNNNFIRRSKSYVRKFRWERQCCKRWARSVCCECVEWSKLILLWSFSLARSLSVSLQRLITDDYHSINLLFAYYIYMHVCACDDDDGRDDEKLIVSYSVAQPPPSIHLESEKCCGSCYASERTRLRFIDNFNPLCHSCVVRSNKIKRNFHVCTYFALIYSTFRFHFNAFDLVRVLLWWTRFNQF